MLDVIIANSEGVLNKQTIVNIINNPPIVTLATLSLFRYKDLFSTLKINAKTACIPINICLRVQAVDQMPLEYQLKVLELLHRGYKNYDVQFTYKNHGSGIPRHDVVNRALNHFDSEFILTLDDDIHMPRYGIESLISILVDNPTIGAVGLWLDPWTAVWEEQNNMLVHRSPQKIIEDVKAIGSATMCVRKEVFKTCNLDPEYYIGWGDMDFCAQMVHNNWKIAMLAVKGLKAVNTGHNSKEYSKIRHDKKITTISKERYYNKWQRIIIP